MSGGKVRQTVESGAGQTSSPLDWKISGDCCKGRTASRHGTCGDSHGPMRHNAARQVETGYDYRHDGGTRCLSSEHEIMTVGVNRQLTIADERKACADKQYRKCTRYVSPSAVFQLPTHTENRREILGPNCPRSHKCGATFFGEGIVTSPEG